MLLSSHSLIQFYFREIESSKDGGGLDDVVIDKIRQISLKDASGIEFPSVLRLNNC